MYKTIIELKEDTKKEDIAKIRQLCIEAHDNRAGKIEIKDISERKFIFEGSSKDFPCFQLGWLGLRDEPLFINNVKAWLWEDKDPEESCDILEEFSKPVYV